jgi:flagellar protein FlbD
VIPVHRLTQPNHELYLNPDLIQTVEATPDTVVTLTTGAKLVVIETPADVAARVRDWRGSIIAAASTAGPPNPVAALLRS